MIVIQQERFTLRIVLPLLAFASKIFQDLKHIVLIAVLDVVILL